MPEGGPRSITPPSGLDFGNRPVTMASGTICDLGGTPGDFFEQRPFNAARNLQRHTNTQLVIRERRGCYDFESCYI